MTKDLSRQLCELAGIEAKHNCNDCKTHKSHGYICNLEWQPNCPTANHVFPDLGNPENFVKLLECLFKFPFSCVEKETYIESIL